MLQQLCIKNYVLIEDLEVNFSNGLTIITGETGAGKTILIGALSLILGQRADSSVLRDKSKKCMIEGHFDIRGYAIRDFFDKYELDFESVTSLRREIGTEGKSRAFINDTPVNLNQLKELGSRLVDIHSQHETLTLQDSGFQLRVVDAFCKHDDLLRQYHVQYDTYKAVSRSLDELHAAEKKSKADLDYFQYLFNELDQAKLQPGEQENLQEELETLSNAEEIKSKLNQLVYVLNAGEINVVHQLDEACHTLRSIARFNHHLEEQAGRIKSTIIEIKDITAEIERLEQHTFYDSVRIENIQERLNIIYNLQQKHRVNTIGELLELREQYSANLMKINSLSEEINTLESQQKSLWDSLVHHAKKISTGRAEAIPKMEKEINSMLAELGMPHAILKIDMQVTTFNEKGMDKINFLFSANKGENIQDLGKVASGGELSRLMLCIKALMARLVTLPTIVFDEIDSGISGEIAFKTGNIIEKIADRHQVIVITHLPQMASRGDSHLQVFKKVGGKKTQTGIRTLDQQERINEIARMLSGDELSDAALENARELLSK